MIPTPTPQPTTMATPLTATADTSGTDTVIASLPVPLVRLLVVFAREIRFARTAGEVVRWRGESPVASWCVVAAWWGVCLGGDAVWRYFLPLVLLVPFIPLPSTPSLTPASTALNPPLILAKQPYTDSSNPATSQTLLLALADLHAINALVPAWDERREWYDWLREMERPRLIRAVAVVWCAWVVVNAVLGARATLAIIGSIVLLLPSPFYNNTITLLRRSLLIRRLAAFTFLFVFGSPSAAAPTIDVKTDEVDALPREPFSVRQWLHGKWSAARRPSVAFRARPKLVTSASLSGSALDTSPPPTPTKSSSTDPDLHPSAPLYFRFELQENQRWWMGLDWTSALLPQERAAWCDVYLNPSSPPQGFSLPRETVVYLPEPRRGDPAGRVKRTARWRWVDEDWIVVRKLQGTGRVAAAVVSATPERPDHARSVSTSSAPAGTGDEPKKGIAEQAFVKGLERLKARTMASGVGLPTGLAGVVNAATSGAKSRPLSGEFSGSSPVTSPELAGRRSEDAQRKGSSGSMDLVHAALSNATQANGVGLGILPDPTTQAPMPMPSADLDAATDMDGWSYGDNKWEGMGPKGGMGKYTRRRRWQRRAICIEEIEYIPGEKPAVAAESIDKAAGKVASKGTPVADVGRLVVGSSVTPTPIQRTVSPASPSPARHRGAGNASRSGSLSLAHHQGHIEGYTVAPATAAPSTPSEVTVTPTTATEVLASSVAGPLSGAGRGRQGSLEDGRDGVLRQRLRNAMGNMGA